MIPPWVCNPPRREFLDWIERYWKDVVLFLESRIPNEDLEYEFDKASDAWDMLCHPEDSTDVLPGKHCRILGISFGSTDADAIGFIASALDRRSDYPRSKSTNGSC